MGRLHGRCGPRAVGELGVAEQKEQKADHDDCRPRVWRAKQTTTWDKPKPKQAMGIVEHKAIWQEKPATVRAEPKAKQAGTARVSSAVWRPRLRLEEQAIIVDEPQTTQAMRSPASSSTPSDEKLQQPEEMAETAAEAEQQLDVAGVAAQEKEQEEVAGQMPHKELQLAACLPVTAQEQETFDCNTDMPHKELQLAACLPATAEEQETFDCSTDVGALPEEKPQETLNDGCEVGPPPGSFALEQPRQWQAPLEGDCSWWEQLLGDTTVHGPDGELYEVFYPPDCVHDNSTEEPDDSTVAGEVTSDSDANSSGALSARGQEVISRVRSDEGVESSHPAGMMSSATHAEMAMEALVTFMSQTAMDRYPARVRLFAMVQAVAAEVLGHHFNRFILVGSTALRIDTPDSDLDAVVFTKAHCDSAGVEVPPPLPAEVLRSIAHGLLTHDGSLRFQLVDCTRVPVLTVLTADATLSLDLTVNQSLGEYHVLWFQRQQVGPAQSLTPLHGVPIPSPDGWTQGLEAAALRCVKWWLRRRSIPLPKEGGFPSIVWTLMVLHVLRCSVFVNGGVEDTVTRGRRLLSAVAAFFDRFAERGLGGTFLFTGCAGAEFHVGPTSTENEDARQASHHGNLSVLDPTTTSEDCAASGVEPSDLAPRTSAATHLLYAYELQRAQRLSALALATANLEEACTDPTQSQDGGAALLELFSDVSEPLNTLSATMLSNLDGVIVLHNNTLVLGILHQIVPKPGWKAAFLHRQDALSAFALRRVVVDDAGTVTKLSMPGAAEWFHPRDFVCMAPFSPNAQSGIKLEAEGLQRWHEMQALLPAPSPPTSGSGRRRRRQRAGGTK